MEITVRPGTALTRNSRQGFRGPEKHGRAARAAGRISRISSTDYPFVTNYNAQVDAKWHP